MACDEEFDFVVVGSVAGSVPGPSMVFGYLAARHARSGIKSFVP